jgi:hypothetical protein
MDPERTNCVKMEDWMLSTHEVRMQTHGLFHRADSLI